MLLDHKIDQNHLILNKLKEMQVQYPNGLRPKEIAGLLIIPEPSVRRTLRAYRKAGLVSMTRINQRCSMYRVVE